MANRPVFRLADAVLLFLFLMLPMMLLLGAAEGTERRPTLLFWLFWLLPFLVLPWLWRRQHPDERVEQAATSDHPDVVTDRAAGELALSVAPVVEVRGGESLCKSGAIPGRCPIRRGIAGDAWGS